MKRHGLRARVFIIGNLGRTLMEASAPLCEDPSSGTSRRAKQTSRSKTGSNGLEQKHKLKATISVNPKDERVALKGPPPSLRQRRVVRGNVGVYSIMAHIIAIRYRYFHTQTSLSNRFGNAVRLYRLNFHRSAPSSLRRRRIPQRQGSPIASEARSSASILLYPWKVFNFV
jgi:hypothetical protein